MNLHETAMGQRFFNVQLPALINTLKDIAAALSHPAPSAISFPADPRFLTSLYYGEYEADVFKPDKRLAPFNQAVQQKEKALLPLLSNEASIAFEQYQAAVQCRNSAVLEQAYASGYRTAVQMFAAGLGPQPPVCTEAEAAANKQFYDSHTREEWEQYIRQASFESSAAMKPVMEAIAQDFVCYQYDENIPVSYGSDRWDLYFWCNPFNGAADASERDFSYFTLTFNERQTLEKRRKVCQQVLELLCSRFQEHPHLHVAVQYSIWFDHPKIHDAVERAKPRLHGLRCIQDQKEGKLLLQDGALLFKPKYAKKYTRTLSQSQILSLSWELGVEDGEPDTNAAPVTLPYKKFGATHPIQLQVTSYLNGNLAIQMVTWESGDPEPWAALTVNLSGQRQKGHAFIDTNADSEFPTWLIRHGLAIPTGRTMQSGFCTYPEYRFRANRLQELDPEGYAGYLKNFERRCSA